MALKRHLTLQNLQDHGCTFLILMLLPFFRSGNFVFGWSVRNLIPLMTLSFKCCLPVFV